jgi:hypothetical protein
MTDTNDQKHIPPTSPEIVDLNLNNGEEICERQVAADWQKEAGEGPEFEGSVSLRCSCSYHQVNPISHTEPAPGMFATGVAMFDLYHPPDFEQANVDVTAKITLTVSGEYGELSRRVNVKCGMSGGKEEIK